MGILWCAAQDSIFSKNTQIDPSVCSQCHLLDAFSTQEDMVSLRECFAFFLFLCACDISRELLTAQILLSAISEK